MKQTTEKFEYIKASLKFEQFLSSSKSISVFLIVHLTYKYHTIVKSSLKV